MTHPDQELIAKAQSDPAAFKKIYDKYTTRIYNYFWYRVSHDKDTAEDLTQDTFLLAFKSLANYQQRGFSYHTYLRTIAHNKLINFYRTPKAMSLDVITDIPAELEDIGKKLDAKIVWQAVQEDLNISDRDVVLFKYRQDLPVKNIARITLRSENAIKIQLSRARKKLRADARLVALSRFPDVKKPPAKPRFLEIKP